MSSENQFAVVNSTVEDMCERVPSAQNCLPEEEEPFEEDLVGPPEPPDTGDLPEDRSCDSPMRIRKIIPFENHAVPINVQPVVLTIGNGDETHLEATLQSADGQQVETNQSTTCYIHEGDEEYHCTYLIEPVTYLEPNTEYMLYVRTTEVHPNPGDVEQSYSHFTTTGSAITDVNTNPVTEIIGYMEREPTAIQECDWKESMKYEVVTAIQEETRDFLTLIQVYEVPDINSTEGGFGAQYHLTERDEFHSISSSHLSGGRVPSLLPFSSSDGYRGRVAFRNGVLVRINRGEQHVFDNVFGLGTGQYCKWLIGA